jgi:hypothetical protein
MLCINKYKGVLIVGRKSNLLNEYQELRERYFCGDESVVNRLEDLAIVLNVSMSIINFEEINARDYLLIGA